MKIILEKEEAEKHFHNALCNGTYFFRYGTFDYKDKDYAKAKKTLAAKIKAGNIPHTMSAVGKEVPTICREDVWMEILHNGAKLKFIDDVEGEGLYTREIGLAEVHARVQDTPLWALQQMIDDEDDAETAEVMLQQVFFGEIVFG
jgi:hypothetical protein